MSTQGVNENSILFKKNHFYSSYHLLILQEYLSFKVHGVLKDRVRRICKLLQNKTSENQRDKKRSGNVHYLSGKICKNIYGHVKKFEVKQTLYDEKSK